MRQETANRIGEAMTIAAILFVMSAAPLGWMARAQVEEAPRREPVWVHEIHCTPESTNPDCLPLKGQEPSGPPKPPADVVLPFTINQCGMPLITVKMDDQDLKLVVDTASTRTRLANEWRTKKTLEHEITLWLDGQHPVSLLVGFVDLSEPKKDCGPMDGLLGNEILSGAHLMEIDYKHHTFILHYGENEHN